jgi:hypothetical protein
MHMNVRGSMRIKNRGEALFMAVFSIFIGVFACLTGQLTASPTRTGTYTIESPAVSIAGAALISVGLWVVFSLVKDRFFQ